MGECMLLVCVGTVSTDVARQASMTQNTPVRFSAEECSMDMSEGL